MLAPPNQGSEAADFFKNDPLFNMIFGQAGQTLGTKQNGIAAQLPAADFDVGIIAGDRSVDPVSSAIIPGVDDGKVSIERSKLKGMKDHIILHVSHLFIIRDDEAVQQAVYYLKEGKFQR